VCYPLHQSASQSGGSGGTKNISQNLPSIPDAQGLLNSSSIIFRSIINRPFMTQLALLSPG